MVPDRKPTGFLYLDCRTLDSQHALITDIHGTPVICKRFVEGDIYGVIGYRWLNHRERHFHKRE